MCRYVVKFVIISTIGTNQQNEQFIIRSKSSFESNISLINFLQVIWFLLVWKIHLKQ